MIRMLFVSILLSLTACVAAEEAPGTITVSGSGSAPATPDRASVSIGIEARGKELDEVQGRAGAVTAKVLALTDELQIDRSAVDTTRASLRADYRYNREANDQEFRGYIAQRQITIEIGNLDNLAAVIEGAVAAGVNNVSPPNLFSSKEKDAYRQALENAARDARANAERVARTLDVKLGAAIAVTTVPTASPLPQARAVAAYDMPAAESYNAGDQTVRASVTAIFRIED